MATKKNNNSRKALAVALGIMGVAGLSLASAAQLTVTASDEAAMGVDTFAACDDAVGIEYTWDGDYNIDSVSITGIADDCLGGDIEFEIVNNTNADISGSESSFTETTTATDDNTWTYTINTPSVSIEDDLGDATVVIS